MATLESIKARSERVGECLIWRGGLNAAGYGYVWHEGRNRATHRVSYELNVGPIPVGLELVDRANVIRLQAERDALQQRLNAADQRIDELEELLTEALRSVDYHAGMQREDGGDRLYGLLSRISTALKLEKVERCHELPGTSGMRLNMLANQGE